MDKIRENGYIAAIGTLVFGVIMGFGGNSVGFSNLTGQSCGVISIIFIGLSIGSFVKPDSIGQIAMKILQNQQQAVMGNGRSQENNQSVTAKNVGGNVVNTVGSNNKTFIFGGGFDASISQESKDFDLFMISMYNIGNSGTHGVYEESLQSVQGFSKMSLFNSINKATQRNLIIDCSTHSGNQWLLSQSGIRYAEALLDEIKNR